MLQKFFKSDFVVSAFIFLLAFVPRLLRLDQFLTADEFLWVDRSRNFLAGLTNAAYQCDTPVEKWEIAEGLACTLRTGHPGVTTMWTGSFGLWLSWLARGSKGALHDFVVGVSTNPLDANFIAPERIGTVIITSLWVVVVYWLLRRLFGGPVALVAALLIALNPFHVALSRVIHHDALSTTFITLSVLAAFIYWGQGAGRKWLFASGVFAGLGILSKSPALYLLPFVALVGIWFAVVAVRNKKEGDEQQSLVSYILKRTLPDGLLWFLVLVVTVFVFWPAMWVIPLEALQTVFLVGSKYATGGHAKGNFFMGEISNDPGPLFYPVTWLYRTSPLVMVGLASLLVVGLIKLLKRDSAVESEEGTDESTEPQPATITGWGFIPLILLFILGYYIFMTIGEKKQDRYFLPVYPWIDILAAIGLVALAGLTVAWFKTAAWRVAVLYGTLLVIVVAINGFFVATHFPYYFTYYNPLLGGVTGASKVITIGWGEGMDVAADYLNYTSDPTRTRVSSWYESTLAPYYYGDTISYSKEKGKALAGDNVIFYINQVQRRFPDDILFEFITSRFAPRQVITLHGQDYVWIYPSLSVDYYSQDQTYTGIASLLAWQWTVGNTQFPPGSKIGFELYWENLGKKPEEPFFFRVIDAQNRVWAEGTSQLVPGENNNPPVEQWREGEILREQGVVFFPPDMPPGEYKLQIGIYTEAPAIPAGELLFNLPPKNARVIIRHTDIENYRLPNSAEDISTPLGETLHLLGANWPQEPVSVGETAPLNLYWYVNQPIPGDSSLHLALMDQSGEAKQAWFNLSMAETFNAEKMDWQHGDILRTRWELELLPDVSPGEYYFEVVLPEDTDQTIPFGRLVVEE